MGCNCNQPSPQRDPNSNCCASVWCDDRLVGLPAVTRDFELVAVKDKCFVRPNGSNGGTVIYGPDGKAYITNQPKLDIPVRQSLLLDEAGRPVRTSTGGYAEDIPPPIDYLLGALCDGLQFRVKGQAGVRQNIFWDGCKYVHEPAPLGNTLDDFQYVGPTLGYCGVFEVVLVSQEDGTVKMGYRSKPSLPPGALMYWGGPRSAVPRGWLICEGQELATSKYPDLFSAWQYGWGGSGLVFRAPDGRGRFARGVNASTGVDPDAATRTNLYANGNQGDDVGTYQTDGLAGTGLTFGEVAGTTAATEERPVNFAVYLMAFAGCIKE